MFHKRKVLWFALLFSVFLTLLLLKEIVQYTLSYHYSYEPVAVLVRDSKHSFTKSDCTYPSNLLNKTAKQWCLQQQNTILKCLKTSNSLREQLGNFHCNGSKISIDDIYITVKTTRRLYSTRVALILKTWFKKGKGKVYFISDESIRLSNFKQEAFIQKQTNNHLLLTRCLIGHESINLCCKTASEFETFIPRTEKWWCHFDDDNYVNVDRLISVLNTYDLKKPFYIGRTAQVRPRYTKKGARIRYWFLTGGAGICITRVLALRMESYMSHGNFVKICSDMGLSDDTALGYIVNSTLGIPITQSMQFHSHLENLTETIDPYEIKSQVTFTYKRENVTPFPKFLRPAFNKTVDPTRFLSIHCLLYRDDEICPGFLNISSLD